MEEGGKEWRKRGGRSVKRVGGGRLRRRERERERNKRREREREE